MDEMDYAHSPPLLRVLLPRTELDPIGSKSTSFDEAGDTIIIVRQKSSTSVSHLLASSKALSLASPVWEEYLKKATSNNDLPPKRLEILMIDADYDALCVLLNIVHLKFDDVSFDIPLDTLTQVAVLCHELQATHLVRPFKEHWIRRHDVPSVDGDARKAKLLLICWMFGCSVTFDRLIEEDINDLVVCWTPAVFKDKLKRALANTGDFNWDQMPDDIFSEFTILSKMSISMS